MGKRPQSAVIVREGRKIPLELTPQPGNFGDGYEHWSAGTRLEQDDRVHVTDLKGGVVIHFLNAHLARAHTGDTALFRTEPLDAP
ncbi:hypothetical protein [Mycolicibacterium sp.]|uniref:hypothetical protein n=1 Tax=Mycolicibacterium sp. TaxID=2320850 RepID=UPI0037C84CD7